MPHDNATPSSRVWPTVLLLAPFVFSFAFAMDVYIPAVPLMKDYFHTSQGNIQLTLSLFMFVIGIGQLIMGPLSDQFGRWRVIIISVIFFGLGSLLCALATSLAMLFVGRIIEAIGGCGMMVAAFAMVRDRFSGNEAAKVYSFLNCGIAMSPLFAPIIGSYLLAWFNWRAEFIFLTAMAVLVVFLGCFKIKETLAPAKRVPMDLMLFKRYWQIFTDRTFMAYTISTSAGLTMFFIFFSSSPYIVIKLLHAPAQQFGFYFFTVGLTFFIGSLISGKIVEKIGAFSTCLLGCSLMLVAGASMLGWYMVDGLSPAQFILPCMLAGLAGAFMMGAGVGGAMEPFAATAGSAAALIGFLEFFISGAVGSYVMTWPVISTTPLAITMLLTGTIALLALAWHGYATLSKNWIKT